MVDPRFCSHVIRNCCVARSDVVTTAPLVQYMMMTRSWVEDKYVYLFAGIMICNWIMVLSCIISVWCTYDTAGAKWVKMKKYQDSMKERRRARRQSGSRRNWRQRWASLSACRDLLVFTLVFMYESVCYIFCLLLIICSNQISLYACVRVCLFNVLICEFWFCGRVGLFI